MTWIRRASRSRSSTPTLLNPSARALLDAGFTPGPSYRLSPPGTVFLSSGTLRVTVSDADRPAAFIVHEHSFEPLELREEASREHGSVAFAVPHFTTVETYFGPFFSHLRTPVQAVVGVPFAVRSEVFVRAATLATDSFSLSGTLAATGPAEPSVNSLPEQTAVTHAAFTSIVDLTCIAKGQALLDHRITVGVERSNLTEAGVALTGDDGDDVRLTRWLLTTVECVEAGEETAESRAAGIYSGNLSFTSLPGWLGGTFSDRFSLELRACGDAILVQRSAQVTLGRFYTTIGHEPAPAVPDFYYAHTLGSGADYSEATIFDLEVEGDTVRVAGVAVGGDHGFGEALSEQEVWAYSLAALLEDGPEMAPDALDRVGWGGALEGELTRTGDADPCD